MTWITFYYLTMSAAPATRSTPQFRVEVDVEAPVSRCFEAAYLESAMLRWVPRAADVTYDHSGAAEPYGPGAVRRIKVRPGLTLTEVVHAVERPHLFAYRFGPDEFARRLVRDYQGWMSFEERGPGSTRLTWAGHFDCRGWQKLIEPVMRALLKKVVATLAREFASYCAEP